MPVDKFTGPEKAGIAQPRTIPATRRLFIDLTLLEW
jgi:hypothetical protein